jgi:hypothetical protein
MRDDEFTKILKWPGYRVFRHEIDETAMTLRLWVRRKRGDRKLICSGCGWKSTGHHKDGTDGLVKGWTGSETTPKNVTVNYYIRINN